MLFGPLAKEGELALPDDPPEAFEWLLEHLYCDERNLGGIEMATQVYKMANKYELDELCRVCSEVRLGFLLGFIIAVLTVFWHTEHTYVICIFPEIRRWTKLLLKSY